MKNLYRIIVFATLFFWVLGLCGGFETATISNIIMVILPLGFLTWRSWDILKSMNEDEVFDFFFLKKEWFED